MASDTSSTGGTLAQAARVMAVLGDADGRPVAETAAMLAGAGCPVFPCLPGGKQPLTRHGFVDATTDRSQVEFWWRRTRHANIGVPTGAASGLDVVDVDVRPTGSGMGVFEKASDSGVGAGWLLSVATPSGGMHFYYPTDPGSPQRSWASASGHVDFRGNGGYIIVPPSQCQVDSRMVAYQVRHVRPTGVPVDAALLRSLVDPDWAERQTARATEPQSSGRVDEAGLARWLAGRGEGERNGGLFWAACRLAEAGRSPDDTQDVLGAAAESLGLSGREITSTIHSAFRSASTSVPASSAAGLPRPVTMPVPSIPVARLTRSSAVTL